MIQKNKFTALIIIAAAVVALIIFALIALLSPPAVRKTSESELAVTSSWSPTQFAAEEEIYPGDGVGGGDTAGETAAEVDQKIIKTGYLDLTVDFVDEAVVKITGLAAGKGGFAQETSVYEREDGTKYGTITIRVPAAEFENAMSELKKLAAAINSETASGQDVTEEYTDLEARLRNAKAQETEYLEILKKATTVTDILAVQSYLGEIREEIETLQGRIQYLKNLTSYSTITATLSEEPIIKIPTKEFRPWSTIKEAGRALVAVGQNLIITSIWLAVLGGGILIPTIVMIIFLVWIARKLWRKYR